jgi:hypothetical protein
MKNRPERRYGGTIGGMGLRNPALPVRDSDYDLKLLLSDLMGTASPILPN